MNKKGTVHDFLEKSGLPIVVVVLVPLGLVAFGIWSAFAPENPPAPAAAQTEQGASAQPAELSLNASSSLPTSVEEGGFVPFSFTIENTGSADAQYQYKVSVQWSTGEEDVIDENVAEIAAGGSKTIAEDLKFEVATETAQVSIELPQSGQTIEFDLPRND